MSDVLILGYHLSKIIASIPEAKGSVTNINYSMARFSKYDCWCIKSDTKDK